MCSAHLINSQCDTNVSGSKTSVYKDAPLMNNTFDFSFNNDLRLIKLPNNTIDIYDICSNRLVTNDGTKYLTPSKNTIITLCFSLIIECQISANKRQ